MIRLPRFRTVAIGAFAAGILAAALPTFAAAPNNTDAAALLTKADKHATMADYYRERMRTDEKHAISYFTMANHCDQKAQDLRTAAQGEPTYRR